MRTLDVRHEVRPGHELHREEHGRIVAHDELVQTDQVPVLDVGQRTKFVLELE